MSGPNVPTHPFHLVKLVLLAAAAIAATIGVATAAEASFLGTYGAVAALVAVATFAYVERDDHPDRPELPTVAVCSLVVGAAWPVMLLGALQMALISWWIAAARQRSKALKWPRSTPYDDLPHIGLLDRRHDLLEVPETV